MKAQFFVMATVIMIYTLMTMIQYVYDFSDINLIQLKKMAEIYYIRDIKDALNKTVLSSRPLPLFTLDCSKIDTDLNATENSLKNVMISRGVNLTINHQITTCSQTQLHVYFNFSLRTAELYTFTEFNSP